MNKEDICFIRVRQCGVEDYCFDGIQKSGYQILTPYKEKNIISRLMREFWFRMKLPQKTIWFNQALCKQNAKLYIVKDPLIIPEFLEWLKKIHPESRIALDYDNRVSNSVLPSKIPDDIEKWSYDQEDCKRYNLYFKKGSYLDVYSIQSEQKKYIDVLYLGRDKGRAEKVLELEKKLINYGLKTHFYICPDRSFLILKKPYYKPFISYSKYLQMLSKSKAILNIVQPGQKSITMREYEAIFDNVKCITNNVEIMKAEFYHKSRYFVLGVDNFQNLKEFLEEKFIPLEQKILNKYRFDNYVLEIYNGYR